MQLSEFMESVNANAELKGIAIDNEQGFVIDHIRSKVCTVVPFSEVEKLDWMTLEDVLMMRQSAKPLYHMTRVCGYYARTANFNPSKLGELADRQKGNYKID